MYLGIKRGDVFNQKILDKRLFDNDEGLSNLYLDRGYLFYES
jgi:outer membrane protein insertion porin family